MNRDFFWETGGLDEGMELWGGENIDISIRVRNLKHKGTVKSTENSCMFPYNTHILLSCTALKLVAWRTAHLNMSMLINFNHDRLMP